MSVREYVGARYVPLFADPIQWSNQNTYEPLTIVVNQGASYTSRQFVPVGIDISNEEYWALTGNYNAQVEQYRQEVQQITPFDDIPTYSSEKGVTSEGVLAGLNKKYIVVLGDSWASPDNNNWPNKVADAWGMTLINAAIGGQSMTSGQYLTQLNTAASQLTTNEKNYVTDVIIEGFVNDIQVNAGSDLFSNTFNALINAINTTFPYAKIHVYWVSTFPVPNSVDTVTVGKYRNLVQSYINIISGKNVNFKINLNLLPLTSEYWRTDFRHPSEIGNVTLFQYFIGSNPYSSISNIPYNSLINFNGTLDKNNWYTLNDNVTINSFNQYWEPHKSKFIIDASFKGDVSSTTPIITFNANLACLYSRGGYNLEYKNGIYTPSRVGFTDPSIVISSYQNYTNNDRAIFVFETVTDL